MPKGYHHLNRDKRCQLHTLLKRGDSISFIAKELQVDKSTIHREIKRNRGKRGYRYKQAQEKALERRNFNKQRRKMRSAMTAIIEEKLDLQWSPEQISGWLKKKGYLNAVSHETIYKYIWEDKKRGGLLYKQLRHRGKKYNKRGKKGGRGCIRGRIDISERPEIVEEKRRLGDWELDTIIGTEASGAIVSMVERKSKVTKLEKVEHKTAENVTVALVDRLSPIEEFVLTLTADNGKEFAFHEQVSQSLKANFYFAKPYHSWERGLNEHTNGLVRQYLPKNKRFDEVSVDDLRKIEKLLNNRPRKVLNYSTPEEVFNRLVEETSSVALRS
jgi:IS30 family transposase